ncbi:NAD(P)-binding protein [Exidia glandulosa HHB12029]|uniref:NAD(P)-binding protein n=1 Tax=Exidia glandulosa HHB12029 TaxID=1314781 RepID=A0A165QJ71_EXIGL|nr:NAD(P)-binding protein [Exidia glandulosa HHB12029]
MQSLFVGQSQNSPPKPKWDAERDMPDLTGYVTIVTGFNVGIGKETAKALLRKNAKVYGAARSKAKAEAAIADLRASSGGKGEIVYLELDLADLASVKRAAEEFLSHESNLDILFNNAGVMVPPIDQLTTQGYDLQFGTNVLGHFYFTKLLLPALLASTHGARTLHTSSSASQWGTIDFKTFKDGPERRKKSRPWLYGQSKLGNVFVAKEFGKRYADRGLVSTSMNPGNINTELQRHMGNPSFMEKLNEWFLYSPALGAVTQLYAGTAPEAKDLNGAYLIPFARVGKPNPMALDAALAQKVWDWLEEQVSEFEKGQ